MREYYETAHFFFGVLWSFLCSCKWCYLRYFYFYL